MGVGVMSAVTNMTGSRRARCGAFTIAELMVACVVMSTALVGVYEMFRQAADIERTASLRWEQRAAADAVVLQIARTIEYAVMLPKVAAIHGQTNEDGSVSIACVTHARAPSNARSGHAMIQRRLYTWCPGTEGQPGGSVEVKTIVYAGSVNVTAGVGGEETGEAEVWNRLPPTVIAMGVDGLSIQYRPADSPNANWEDHFSGPANNIVVALRVRVGGQTIEHFVVPHVNRQLLEEAQARTQ
jgi:hypothetical protein